MNITKYIAGKLTDIMLNEVKTNLTKYGEETIKILTEEFEKLVPKELLDIGIKYNLDKYEWRHWVNGYHMEFLTFLPYNYVKKLISPNMEKIGLERYNKKEELIKKWRSLKDELYNNILACRTVNKLKEKFPEAYQQLETSGLVTITNSNGKTAVSFPKEKLLEKLNNLLNEIKS